VNYNKPIINEIEQLELSDVNHYHLDNNIPVYELNYPNSAEVVKIEFIYNAGRWYEQQKLSAKLCAALVKEGSMGYNSKQIANTLDYYGAYLHVQSSMDFASLNVLCLNKHFASISDLISDTIYQPSFQESEFNKYKIRAVENLKMQLSKNDVIGYRELTEKLFSSTHPYGYNSIEKDYQNLNLDNVKAHYQNLYTPDNGTLFISGNINDSLRKEINETIGLNNSLKAQINTTDPLIKSPDSLKNRVKGKQAVQKSIYIGGRLFNRAHPDYFGMVVLNTVLGGYFSSRLNLKIREKAGLSYGVDSQLDIMSQDGFFFISTEVENKNETAVIKAIYEELDALKIAPISEEELANAKRYIKGRVLGSLDGPFKQIKVLQSLVLNDIPIEMFKDRLHQIDMITSNDLMRLANIYYDENQLIEVVVEGEK